MLSGINEFTTCTGPLDAQDSGGDFGRADGYEDSRVEWSDEEVECQPAKRARMIGSGRGRWEGESSDMTEQAGGGAAEELTGEIPTLEHHSLEEATSGEVSGKVTSLSSEYDYRHAIHTRNVKHDVKRGSSGTQLQRNSWNTTKWMGVYTDTDVCTSVSVRV